MCVQVIPVDRSPANHGAHLFAAACDILDGQIGGPADAPVRCADEDLHRQAFLSTLDIWGGSDTVTLAGTSRTATAA